MEKGVTNSRRIESPSSINTFLQCRRKYYYRYIARLPSKPNIHQIRGKVIHSVLEDFFDTDLDGISSHDYYDHFRLKFIELFNKHWVKALNELIKLGMEKEKIKNYYIESLDMLNNFLYRFCEKIDKETKTCSLKDAFLKLKPKREIKLVSDKYRVRGFIDAIDDSNGEIILWDYKTSRKDKISDEYYLQLGIYAMMYYENHGKYPDKVGINFLLHGERIIDVKNEIVENAKEKCNEVHTGTLSSDIKDYPQNIGPLCRWSTGQCDYYDECFGQKKLNSFVEKPSEKIFKIN